MSEQENRSVGRGSWRRRASAFGVVAGLVTVVPGCGDGPICPGEVFIAITSPSDEVEIGPSDDNAEDPGIQIDVRARSNLGEGEIIDLVVRDDAEAVATFTAALDREGKAIFRNVTIPPGEVRLEALASSSACGAGTDAVTISVTDEARCELTIIEGPIAREFYAPIPVLNTTNDSDASLPGFQAHIDIEARAGDGVELFVLDLASGQEASAGSETATGTGFARFHLTLGQGPQALRALCRSQQGASASISATHTVFVDTEPPVCELVYPPAGQAIASDLDEDPEADGTQITLVGQVDDEDVSPGSAVFEVAGQPLASTPFAGGQSTALATFGAPGEFNIAFSATDHAGNTCAVQRQVEHVIEGCAITHEAPTEIITEDDSSSIPGVQTELAVQVDPACEGRTVTTSCDVSGAQSAQAIAGALTTMQITVCEDDLCEQAYDCETRVSNEAGVVTSAGATIEVNTLPSELTLEFVPPVSNERLGRRDGKVISGELELDICGTVNADDASVQVSIDGDDPQPATAVGTDWCLENARLAEGEREIVATAVAGGEVGERAITVDVDLTPPGRSNTARTGSSRSAQR